MVANKRGDDIHVQRASKVLTFPHPSLNAEKYKQASQAVLTTVGAVLLAWVNRRTNKAKMSLCLQLEKSHRVPFYSNTSSQSINACLVSRETKQTQHTVYMPAGKCPGLGLPLGRHHIAWKVLRQAGLHRYEVQGVVRRCTELVQGFLGHVIILLSV